MCALCTARTLLSLFTSNHGAAAAAATTAARHARRRTLATHPNVNPGSSAGHVAPGLVVLVRLVEHKRRQRLLPSVLSLWPWWPDDSAAATVLEHPPSVHRAGHPQLHAWLVFSRQPPDTRQRRRTDSPQLWRAVSPPQLAYVRVSAAASWLVDVDEWREGPRVQGRPLGLEHVRRDWRLERVCPVSVSP